MNPVLRVVSPGVREHWCEGCCCFHRFDVHALNADGRVNGWDGDMERPTLDGKQRFEMQGSVCEYVLEAGVAYFSKCCTHTLAGESRHLRPVVAAPPN